MGAVAAEGNIIESGTLHPVRLVEISAIDHIRRFETAKHPFEVRGTVFAPVGNYDQGIGAIEDVVLVMAVLYPVAEELPCFIERFGVVHLHFRSCRKKVFYDGE